MYKSTRKTSFDSIALDPVEQERFNTYVRNSLASIHRNSELMSKFDANNNNNHNIILTNSRMAQSLNQNTPKFSSRYPVRATMSENNVLVEKKNQSKTL